MKPGPTLGQQPGRFGVIGERVKAGQQLNLVLGAKLPGGEDAIRWADGNRILVV